MRAILQTLVDGGSLGPERAGRLLRGLTDPEVDPALKGALLVALRIKGETAEEIVGMALAMRDAARPLRVDPEGPPWIDTCGTGGDGSGTINISTGASLVLAATGLRVVKHGNRSVSSRSGSADVLEALGIRIPEGPTQAGDQLARTGWTFLFAPRFHPAMKAVVPVRRALQLRTVFNLLGPLTNPARPPYQVVGAWSPAACERMAHALARMPVERAAVVHGAPGWDEATPVGPFTWWAVEGGEVRRREVDPRERYGLSRCAPEELVGGDAADNARALRAVFDGARGPHRDAILLNAAVALEVAGLARGREALERAAEAVDQGRVRALLEALG